MAKTMNGERLVAVREEVDNHGWIAVSDRLPERMNNDGSWSHSVWCIVDDYDNKYPFVGQYNLERDEWYDANDEATRLDEIGDVTYWMPIEYPV